MKHVSSLTLSFLLFIFITNLSLAFSNDNAEQVLDVDFNHLSPGREYYIMPANVGPSGGGVKIGTTGGSSCPLTVLQEYSADKYGLPVKFTIPDISTGIIFTGAPIEIEFIKKPTCVESSKWLVFVDNVIRRACVGIGGPENYPEDVQTLTGTFNIRKHEYGFAYKLVFCYEGSPTNCLDVGRYDNIGEDGSRLSLNEYRAHQVVFEDAAIYEAEFIKSVV